MIIAAITLLLIGVIGFRLFKKDFSFANKIDQVIIVAIAVGGVLGNTGILAITEKILRVTFNVVLVLFVIWGSYQLYLLWQKKKTAQKPVSSNSVEKKELTDTKVEKKEMKNEEKDGGNTDV